MVPVDLRIRVVKNYNPKQSMKNRPSDEWLKAAREAINFVKKKEGKWSTKH